jgi:hypothetical protein
MSQIFVRHAYDAEILQKVKFFCSANALQKHNHGLSKNVCYSFLFCRVFFYACTKYLVISTNYF